MKIKNFLANKEIPKKLKLVKVSIFGTMVRVLYDSDAMPNVMYAKWCSDFRFQVLAKWRLMKMADCTEAWVEGEVSNNLVTVDGMNCQLNFLAVRDALFCAVFGRTSITVMRVSLNFDKNIETFFSRGNVVTTKL